MELTNHFAHVFLFRCLACGGPLSSTCISALQNLEQADAHRFEAYCHCGWNGAFTGLVAVKHWVEPWEKPLQNEHSNICDGEALG